MQHALVKGIVRDLRTNHALQIVDLPGSVFNMPLRQDIVWRCVVWQQDMMRQGAASTKGRGQVRGSTAKIQPQKKLGRARAGSKRAPQMRGGGVVHGPTPRIHATRLPVKVRELGLRTILSEKLRDGLLLFADSLPIEDDLNGMMRQHHPPMTKEALVNAEKHHGTSSTLFLTGSEDEPLEIPGTPSSGPLGLSIPPESNLEGMHVDGINVLSLLKHHYVVVDSLALDRLIQRLNSK